MVFINDVQYLELKSNELTTSTYLCSNDVYDGDALWWLPLTTVCVCSSVLSTVPAKTFNSWHLVVKQCTNDNRLRALREDC